VIPNNQINNIFIRNTHHSWSDGPRHCKVGSLQRGRHRRLEPLPDRKVEPREIYRQDLLPSLGTGEYPAEGT